ncbi:MAG: glycosyltransferase family 2 protein [Pseudomonadota bacterium]
MTQFSVVIPLYNKRDFIRRAVDSVLAQSHSDFELIVVDDGSTDGSAETLGDIEDPRLILIRQDNQGEGAARNTGLATSRNDWIALLDGDDFWLDNHLYELNRVIGNFPDAGLVSTRTTEVWEGSNAPQGSTKNGTIGKIDYFAEAGRNIGILNASSVAIKREVYSEIGGFSLFKVGADLEYWARIAVFYPVAMTDAVTSIYVRGTGGVMDNLVSEPVLKNVDNLQDISRSVAFLVSAIESGNHSVPRDRLETYIDGRLITSAWGAMRWKRFDIARQMLSMCLGSLSGKARYMALSLKFPDVLLNVVIEASLKLRSLFRPRRA